MLALSDILVTTSKQEGLPVNVMEAMASKKPIIASNIRGHVDLIQHELNGLLFDYQDVNLLRKHILNLYNNRRLSETLGANSQMKISEYSTNSVMHEMANIYEKFM
ncbi:putative glycosyltransferase EpsD [compost metagenome]